MSVVLSIFLNLIKDSVGLKSLAIFHKRLVCMRYPLYHRKNLLSFGLLTFKLRNFTKMKKKVNIGPL